MGLYDIHNPYGDPNLHTVVLNKIDEISKKQVKSIDDDMIIIEGHSPDEIDEYIFEQKRCGLIRVISTTNNQNDYKTMIMLKVTLKGYDYLEQHKNN